jgi:hypothetical protein
MLRSIASVAALAVTLSLTGPARAATKKATKAPQCPACKMTLATKKSATNPKAVKIGGKTYYCCSGCDMSKKPGGAEKKEGTAVK